MGDVMLKLIGVESNNEYQPRAIVLKEKRLYLIHPFQFNQYWQRVGRQFLRWLRQQLR
jgi:hypothetical protein